MNPQRGDAVSEKIPVGVSSCLLGERVRFDGGHKQNRFLLDTLSEYFEFRPFCPEMAIGLGVPRQTIHLVPNGDSVSAVGVRDSSLDVTDQLVNAAQSQRHWHAEICGYVVKKDSPSCGMDRVRVYYKSQPQRNGVGVYTRVLMENFPALPVEEEGRLGDPVLREGFIKRVYVYQRWKQLLAGGLSWSALTDFQARHKLMLYSHHQERGRALGRALADAQKKRDIDEFAAEYILQLMDILSVFGKRSNHVNVLEHIRGYLKNHLDRDDKRELGDSIEGYRQGILPLIVPITLLRHHFRKFPNHYIERSFYLRPHPDRLKLLNSI